MNKYPNKDIKEFTKKVYELIELSKNNHPAAVGATLVSIGTQLLLDLSPTVATGISAILEGLHSGLSISKLSDEDLTEDRENE